MAVLKLIGASPVKSYKQRDQTWNGNNRVVEETANTIATPSIQVHTPTSNMLNFGYSLNSPVVNYQDAMNPFGFMNNQPALPSRYAPSSYVDPTQAISMPFQDQFNGSGADISTQFDGFGGVPGPLTQDNTVLGEAITNPAELHAVMQYQANHDGQMPAGYAVDLAGIYRKLPKEAFALSTNNAMINEGPVPKQAEFDDDLFSGEGTVDHF
jgi:hypothetical protein